MNFPTKFQQINRPEAKPGPAHTLQIEGRPSVTVEREMRVRMRQRVDALAESVRMTKQQIARVMPKGFFIGGELKYPKMSSSMELSDIEYFHSRDIFKYKRDELTMYLSIRKERWNRYLGSGSEMPRSLSVRRRREMYLKSCGGKQRVSLLVQSTGAGTKSADEASLTLYLPFKEGRSFPMEFGVVPKKGIYFNRRVLEEGNQLDVLAEVLQKLIGATYTADKLRTILSNKREVKKFYEEVMPRLLNSVFAEPKGRETKTPVEPSRSRVMLFSPGLGDNVE